MTVGLLLVLLSSCVDTPEPVRWPVINIVNAESEGNTVLLSAQIGAEADLVSKCGFMFGDDKDNLEKHPSVLNENAFSAVILNVEYDKEYFYSAYAGNGRNEICTDVYSIRIHPLQLPETPEDSTPPDNPTNPGDQTPSEDVTPPDDPTIPEDQIPSEDTDTHGGIDYEIMDNSISFNVSLSRGAYVPYLKGKVTYSFYENGVAVALDYELQKCIYGSNTLNRIYYSLTVILLHTETVM